MRKQLLSALVATIAWVGFDGSGNIGSIAQAWVVTEQQCWVTGGGRIDFDDTFATFGFNAVAPFGELKAGHITTVNHNTQETTAFFCKLDTLNCDCPTPALLEEFGPQFEGIAQFSGTLIQLGPGGGPIGSCLVTVLDNGEPGSQIPGTPGSAGPDEIIFETPVGGILGEFLLTGGNVQIHGCKPHGNG